MSFSSKVTGASATSPAESPSCEGTCSRWIVFRIWSRHIKPIRTPENPIQGRRWVFIDGAAEEGERLVTEEVDEELDDERDRC
ncbi:hypothetical protein PanWU01x14_000080 [Parasponia andersonii]|uniref:Uncharacterized protein n=1 Tax=Parasponia andersonii TaxID=3476 RepID=A0A2P5E4I8_PARAD|nr:hypothetical protein PanWU01x14_000080 [Parasponia andersonii]